MKTAIQQQSDSGVQRSAPKGAVFISYASQDAAAAREICNSLRGAGVEVWFDQNELRGGDAWDTKIRQQIKECALFVPVISRHTQERLEGYFRLEWHLAERRMHTMHEDAAFLLPVAIDELATESPRVPPKFFDVQWTRVVRDQPAPDFAQRVTMLLRSGAHGVPGNGSPARETRDEREPSVNGSRLSRAGLRHFKQSSASSMNGDKILIIEDDPTMQRVLKDNFEFSGYDVRAVSDGAAAIEAVFAQPPDVILLDIMLPRINGFDVCRRLRKEGFTIPIIMLTAKSQESDIVLGLNLGADDYVAKPFSMEVLLARVQTCLRRRGATTPRTEAFRFGECELHAASHRVFRDGAELELTPKEFKLLEFFVQNVGRALTRQRILDGVWGEDLIVTERSVDRCVTTLRNKVEPDPERPRFIKTIRDVGYRFEIS